MVLKMKKSTFNLLIVVTFSLSFVFFSCNNGQKSNGKNQNVEVQNSFSDSKGKSAVYTKYGLPLPVEVAKLLKEKDIEFRMDLMNPTENADRYFTDLSKAINLGFYSSDLAYCTIYDKGQESVNYFSVSIELAGDLDITEGYNENVLNRTYDNLNNNDTLCFIAAEAYWVTCRHLEKNNKINILPYIIVGSWLESQYIFANIVEKDMSDSPLYEEFYNQLHDKEINEELLLPSIELVKKMHLEYIK